MFDQIDDPMLEDSRERGFFKPVRPPRMKFARINFKGGGSASIEDTADQKALADIARERWQRYQSAFVPIENKYIDEVMNYDNASRMSQVSGMGNVNVQGAFGEAQQQQMGQAFSQGMNPGSGQFNAMMNQTAASQMYAAGDNMSRGQQAIQDAKITGMQNVVAIGQGVAGNAMSGLQDAASYSAEEAARRAENSFNSRQAIGYGLGLAAGGAIGYQAYGQGG